MGETQQILALWRRALARGEKVSLATVVHVEGSSYRKPGARMLVTEGGERSGTVSGGCLENEVSRKIWWLTQMGPTVQRYQSSFDEDGGGVPWGLGCGGTVWLLVEREPSAVLEALAAAAQNGRPSVVLSSLSSPAGTLCVTSDPDDARVPLPLRAAVTSSLKEHRSLALNGEGVETRGMPAFFAEYLQPPPRLTIFGAGDDAQPIARFAGAMDWRVTIADGRSHLLRSERFPEIQDLRLLEYGSGADLICGPGDGGPVNGGPGDERCAAPAGPPVCTGVCPGELAVVLTHSFEQDRALLHALLPEPLAYLGILGPRHRTARLIEQVAPALNWSIEKCWSRLHAPVGLDLGARDPAAIALAIVADLQATLNCRRVEVHRVSPPLVAAHG